MIRIARSGGIRNIVEPMVPSSLIERYTAGSRPATGSERAKSFQRQSFLSAPFLQALDLKPLSDEYIDEIFDQVMEGLRQRKA